MKKKTLFKIIAACGIIAGGMYLLNKKIIEKAAGLNLLAEYDDQYYNWKFGKIKYTTEGSGAPLLLIHSCTPEASSHEWKRIRERLIENFKVYTMDLIGCGLSDKPKISYSNFLFAKLINDFVKDVIKKECDEPVNVLTSAGSAPLIISAVKYNSCLFNKIILVNPADTIPENTIPKEILNITAIKLRLPLIGKLTYNALMSRPVLKYKYINDICCDKTAMEEYISSCYEASHKMNNGGRYLYSNIADKLMSFDINHCISSIPNELYIIESEKGDRIITEEYQNNCRKENHYKIEDSSIMPHIENPDKFVEVVEEILNKTEEQDND